MEKKTVKCIFVGYDNQRKGWRCCDPTIEKCYTSRNVVVDEASSWWSSGERVLTNSNSSKDVLESSPVQLGLGGNESADESEDGEVVATQDQASEYQQQSENGDSNRVSTPLPLRRSTRVRKPNPKYVNAAVIEAVKEPETFEEAFQKLEWINAMEEEVIALEQNQTWELIPKPKDVKPISYKWVYKVKRNADGSIKRFKARLVARGFSQQYELDYDEVFSPVAKLVTVRVLLALAANKDWDL
ncbi:PREDICTED: uncharacterized protein LOC109174043 [Ipomoea nil]|uniref:uncharacterized protein LOC109174043 n=1 Tax=Ipomoea nil TaxID=35883 RepID=UPI000901F248|nr:PREDICTED: uncharacterized protein LOC109174043 [Ipomoea nil]